MRSIATHGLQDNRISRLGKHRIFECRTSGLRSGRVLSCGGTLGKLELDHLNVRMSSCRKSFSRDGRDRFDLCQRSKSKTA